MDRAFSIPLAKTEIENPSGKLMRFMSFLPVFIKGGGDTLHPDKLFKNKLNEIKIQKTRLEYISGV